MSSVSQLQRGSFLGSRQQASPAGQQRVRPGAVPGPLPSVLDTSGRRWGASPRAAGLCPGPGRSHQPLCSRIAGGTAQGGGGARRRQAGDRPQEACGHHWHVRFRSTDAACDGVWAWDGAWRGVGRCGQAGALQARRPAAAANAAPGLLNLAVSAACRQRSAAEWRCLPSLQCWALSPLQTLGIV